MEDFKVFAFAIPREGAHPRQCLYINIVGNVFGAYNIIRENIIGYKLIPRWPLV